MKQLDQLNLTNMQLKLEILPNELIQHILKFLSPADLFSLKSLSSFLRDNIDDYILKTNFSPYLLDDEQRKMYRIRHKLCIFKSAGDLVINFKKYKKDTEDEILSIVKNAIKSSQFEENAKPKSRCNLQ